MKILNSIVVLFLVLNSLIPSKQKPFLNYSEKTSGVVIYKFYPNAEYMDNLKKKENYEYYSKMYAMMKDETFVLKFNKNASLFQVEERLDSDTNGMAHKGANIMIAEGSYYTNNNDKIFLQKTELGGEEFIIKLKQNDFAWNVTKETKTINGYKCFKATREKVISNTKGSYKFEIEAWFAPTIPRQFGPKNFHGLPGLILELKDSHFTLVAKEINFQEEENKIEKFKGKSITEEEFAELSRKGLKNFKSSIKN